MPAIAGDDRALIQSKGRNLENTKEKEFTDGYTICKFKTFMQQTGQQMILSSQTVTFSYSVQLKHILHMQKQLLAKMAELQQLMVLHT